MVIEGCLALLVGLPSSPSSRTVQSVRKTWPRISQYCKLANHFYFTLQAIQKIQKTFLMRREDKEQPDKWLALHNNNQLLPLIRVSKLHIPDDAFIRKKIVVDAEALTHRHNITIIFFKTYLSWHQCASNGKLNQQTQF